MSATRNKINKTNRKKKSFLVKLDSNDKNENKNYLQNIDGITHGFIQLNGGGKNGKN